MFIALFGVTFLTIQINATEFPQILSTICNAYLSIKRENTSTHLIYLTGERKISKLDQCGG